MKRDYWLAISLGLVIILVFWYPALADGPQGKPDQDSHRRAGLTSTATGCLVVEAGATHNPSGIMHLEWEGQIEEAFLVLAVAGSEGEHSIYINGKRVGQVPVRPDGQPCQPGYPIPTYLSTDVIPIPTEILLNGDNVITLTNDANLNDSWTATNLRLEVHGDLGLPPAPQYENTSPITSGLGTLSAADVITGSVTMPNQVVWYQVPISATASAPLVVLIHGWGGDGEDGINSAMAVEAKNRGWLLVAPNLHGNYYAHGRYSPLWPGSQHDILDAIEYMQSSYGVDPTRIYIIGGSMGGQATTLMAAKYPDIFAAASAWKGITDLASFYNNDIADDEGFRRQIRWEIAGTNPAPDATPENEPFEYSRRSSMAIPQNLRTVPLRLWHDEEDLLVQPYHSYNLRDAVNNWNPPPIIPTQLITVPTAGCSDEKRHCYIPDPSEVFDFLADFTLSSEPPTYLAIRTDESKPYYWLNFVQTGGDHWSEAEATYSLINHTVTAAISDTNPLTLAFNLGSTPIPGRPNINQAGMGLPATTYLIRGGGNYELEDYTSGYLTTTLSSATNPFSLTISAITIEVSANPNVIEEQAITSTITAVVKDRLNNPGPDNTTVVFSATKGAFLENGSSTYTTTITGGQGQATATLTTDDPSQIGVSVESVSGSTFIGYAVYLPVLLKNN